jgi:hypothetical protein
MSQTLKVLSNSVFLGTANKNIFNARCVRIQNLGNSTVVITQSDVNANAQIANLYLVANDFAVIQKSPTDVLSSNNSSNNVVCVAVAYSY